MNTDKLTEELKKRINYCNNENPDDRNWGHQEGVLLSVNEAKHFLHLLSLPKETDAVEWISVEDLKNALIEIFHLNKEALNRLEDDFGQCSDPSDPFEFRSFNRGKNAAYCMSYDIIKKLLPAPLNPNNRTI